MTDFPVIRVRGLRNTYGDTTAVAGVDLDVATGEVVALLGPNGAGKTSTIDILQGHRDRDSGEVSVLGRDPAHVDLDWRAEIGVVAQDSDDLTELTVTEAVRHFARYYPGHRDPAEVIELVGLTDKTTARVRTLSGGQRRRQFWALIRRLADEGTPILFSTHYLDEAEALADRVAIIVGGRIVADGTPATLVAALTRRYGGTVPGLTVSRPSLEDVYLDLIGATP
ncbi:ABC transporter ATP-binding protein [Micromonospora craniellae]|uniref:ABC transporter ATP-binding protein n=1 Tax=Micromonospora craniellae TaxID=2294034 RepID=A0A372FSI1_9ACTN|nr:ABC transporter ATP-binding protein [Micromonospora craniellae]QOC91328.1 ABC transporter ATP-binding protein [Micromonospora craniellae]RFS43480.1 ABC transporter ATP-binding protein [Micromonospora craniellae]